MTRHNVLWNNSYSWGPMFVVRQHIAGWWGVMCHARQFITLLNMRRDVNSCMGTNNLRTLTPTNNDYSTVILLH